jgi:hypothetical protein
MKEDHMTDEPMMTPEDATQETQQGEGASAAPEMRAEDAVRFAIGLFADLAWINLGIRANPASGDTKTDLPEAKLAIDALAALIPLLEGRMEAHEMRDLRNLLSSLQLNFVQRASVGA